MFSSTDPASGKTVEAADDLPVALQQVISNQAARIAELEALVKKLDSDNRILAAANEMLSNK
jgi:cell division protein FtsL